jgi:hypothetical protein
VEQFFESMSKCTASLRRKIENRGRIEWAMCGNDDPRITIAIGVRAFQIGLQPRVLIAERTGPIPTFLALWTSAIRIVGLGVLQGRVYVERSSGRR